MRSGYAMDSPGVTDKRVLSRLNAPRLYAAMTGLEVAANVVVSCYLQRTHLWTEPLREPFERVAALHAATGFLGIIAMMLCKSGRELLVVLGCMALNYYLALASHPGLAQT
jgi:hypothetical protein